MGKGKNKIKNQARRKQREKAKPRRSPRFTNNMNDSPFKDFEKYFNQMMIGETHNRRNLGRMSHHERAVYLAGRVTPEGIALFRQAAPEPLDQTMNPEDWIILTVENSKLIFYGPFDNLDQLVQFGNDQFGIPEWHFAAEPENWYWPEISCPLCQAHLSPVSHTQNRGLSVNGVYINELNMVLNYPLCGSCHRKVALATPTERRALEDEIETHLLSSFRNSLPSEK